MTGILAIETATDACSVAMVANETARQLHELAPKRHSQRLFSMLAELVPGGDFNGEGIECLAYGSGPGSFTGLRIAASAIQGIAYSTGIPVVGVSTLATLAQTALRSGEVCADDIVLATLDARLNECYSAFFTFEHGLAVQQAGPWAVAPHEHPLFEGQAIRAVGNGSQYVDSFPAELRERIVSCAVDLVPEALDVVALAKGEFSGGHIQSAQEVAPVYVRDEISWKKLSEQKSPKQGARK